MYDAKFLGTRPGVDSEIIDLITEPLFISLSSCSPKDSISKNCLKCDMKLGLEAGTSLYIVQHMLVNKLWKTDMNQLIRENSPLTLFVDSK